KTRRDVRYVRFPYTTLFRSLMQQRGLAKDTNPGMLDPAVSGHLGAGESVEDGFREMEEEIGILPDPAKMRHVGTRPRAAEHTTRSEEHTSELQSRENLVCRL